jgi:energy-coupling factor transporter ATP-binding protein EcfA2
VEGTAVVIAGPGGVGKSTLLATLADSDRAVSDNLCAAGPDRMYGLLEPVRDEHGSGRRMPHGRHERAWTRRADSLAPQRIIVLQRGDPSRLVVRPATAEVAARELVAGTYAAGELRRYWAFAATLALGLGLGPAHPPIAPVSETLAGAIPCTVAQLPAAGRPTLAQLVTRAVAADLLDLDRAGGQTLDTASSAATTRSWSQ